MIKSSVTVSLVDEARGGPFVYWDDLAAACGKAKGLGYDAIELFAPGANAVDKGELKGLLEEHGLELAAVGTGAGMVIHGLSLTSGSASERERARGFVKEMIDYGGEFGASAIIGSMQGRHGSEVSPDQAMGYLKEALVDLGHHAKAYDMPLIYEPLNRYETNLINRMGDGAALCESLGEGANVVLLADLFHMNIEETTVADGVRDGGKWIGHVHFVDSNRRPVGLGHTDFGPIVEALKDIGYDGYASAEAFAYPDSDEAARLTMEGYRRWFG